MKLSSAIHDFFKYLKNEYGASPKTLENYEHYLKKFLDFAGDIEVSSIDLALARKYRLYLAKLIDPKFKKPLKRVTQNYFLIALRSLLRFLKQRGVETLDAQAIKLGAAERQTIKMLDEISTTKLLQALDVSSKQSLRDKALIEILLASGLKVSELVNLNKDQINLRLKKLVVIRKNGSKRVIFLPETTVLSLNQYLKGRRDTFKPLFIRFQGRATSKGEGETMRLSVRSVQRIVEKYAKKANLPLKATPSILRHSFAKGVLQKGENLKSLQEYLGHHHLSSTQVYKKAA